MKNKKILLTGCNGYIGSFIKKKLKNNYNITGIDLHNFNNIISNPKFFFKNKYYAIIFAHGKDSVPRARVGEAGPKKNNKTSQITDDFMKSQFINNLFNANEILEFIDTNLLFNLKLIKYYLEHNNKGRIINFSSIYSLRSPKHFLYRKNFIKHIGYSVSKSASNIAMMCLGNKYGKNFLFNNIILGGVERKGLDKIFVKNYNNNNPLQRMMKLNEVIPVVNFLLDKNNTYMNSQNLIVDGGFTSW
jgi:NAD(P)-dependent dehydrogenase (short-subunit alcohol dehydrogenase family)